MLVSGTGGWADMNAAWTASKTICGDKETCTLVPQGGVDTFHRVWKISGGSIENDECGTVAGISGLNFPPPSGANISVAEDEERWNQGWKVIAHEAVLMTENHGPYQEWKAHFIDPPYDYALLPGFPGPIQTAAPVIKRVGINTTTGEYIQIFELEIFDPTGTNVVRGKAATSSSVHHTPSIFPGGTAGPSNAVDGDLTNVFHTNSRHDGGDNNPWLNIDLGASVEACKIVIYNKWCGDVNDSAHPCLCRLSQANLKLYDSSNNVIKTINVGDTCGKAILEYDLCLKPEIAKTAMNRCDESMALLVGSQTSLGTLKAIADLVTEEGPERMPGSCCFDTPTSNDNYFGVAVRQLL
jgi:hypothetical protein